MVVIKEAEVVVNVVDNVTAALDRINKLLGQISEGQINLTVGSNTTDSIANLEKNIDSLSQTVTIGVNVENNTEGLAKAVQGIDGGAQKAAASVSTISTATQKVGSELDNTKRKSAGFFDSFKAGAHQISDSLGGITQTLAALAMTGAVGGFSWSNAKQSAQYKEEVIAAIGERYGADEAAMASQFIGEAGSKGQEYTSGTQRTELLFRAENDAKLRGEKAMQVTRGIEKLAFTSDIAEMKGYDAETLMRVATRQNLRGLRPDMESDINAIFGKGFTKKGLSTRMKIIAEFDKKIDIEEAMKEEPEKVFAREMDKTSKSIGSTMIGPMNVILGKANAVADVFQSIPAASSLAGWGIMATTAALALGMLAKAAKGAFDGLKIIIGAATGLKSALLGSAAATATNTAASLAAEAAAKAEAAARTEEAIAARMASQVGVSDTAISAQNAIAKRARAAADLAAARAAAINSLETSTNTGAQAANTGATNVSIASRLRLAAANIYHSVATRLSNAATAISTAGSWAAVAVTTVLTGLYGLLTGTVSATTVATSAGTIATTAFAAAEGVATAATAGLLATLTGLLLPLAAIAAVGMLVVGALALIAAKSGIVGPLLKGIASIDLGKIWKDLERNDFDKAWRDLTKGFKLPSLKEMWSNITEGLPDISKLFKFPSGEIKMNMMFAVAPILAPIMLAVRALDQILDVGKIIQDAAGVGISLWKKLVEGITWLYDKAKDGVRFISDIFDKLTEVFNAIIALPGDIAAKIKSWLPGGGGEEGGRTPEENEAGYEVEENYGAGVHAMGANEDVIPPNEFAMNYLNYGTKFGEEPVYGQNNEPLLNSEGEQLKVKDIYPIEKVEQDLTKIIKNNEVLKSTEGISFGEGTRAQDWLQKAVTAKEPNDVALHMWSHLGPGIVNEGNESVTEKIGAFFGVTPTPTARAFRAEEGQLGGYDIYNGENVLRKNMGIPTLEEAQKRVDEFNALSQQQIEARKDQFAGGAVFNKGGFFAGIVHEKEEIIPQATAQRGAGPISKALGDLQSAGHGREKSVNIHVDGMKVELNNPVVPDAGAAYHLTDILKRELEPFIEEKVKRSIGQYIT